MLCADDLFTRRLRLRAIAPDLLRLESIELSQKLGADVPKMWPPDHWEPHVLDLIEKQYREAPGTVGWNRFIILEDGQSVAVGTLGGFLRTPSEAEVGYSILQPWHGQGIATEALAAHVRSIFEKSAEIASICAHTFPSLAASVRVLEKCGFALAGEGDEEGTVRYRVMRAVSVSWPGS